MAAVKEEAKIEEWTEVEKEHLRGSDKEGGGEGGEGGANTEKLDGAIDGSLSAKAGHVRDPKFLTSVPVLEPCP